MGSIQTKNINIKRIDTTKLEWSNYTGYINKNF